MKKLILGATGSIGSSLARKIVSEGGEVHFIKRKCRIKNKKGHALIHPGRITHYHEGLPITKGKRYVFISFVN